MYHKLLRWLKKTLVPDLAAICQLDEFRLGRPRMAFKVQVAASSNGPHEQEAGNDHDKRPYIPMATASGKVLFLALVFKSPKGNVASIPPPPTTRGKGEGWPRFYYLVSNIFLTKKGWVLVVSKYLELNLLYSCLSEMVLLVDQVSIHRDEISRDKLHMSLDMEVKRVRVCWSLAARFRDNRQKPRPGQVPERDARSRTLQRVIVKKASEAL
eukprot:Rmarinus@m.14541